MNLFLLIVYFLVDWKDIGDQSSFPMESNDIVVFTSPV